MVAGRPKEKDPFWFPLVILILADVVTFFGSVMLAYFIRFSPWLMSSPWFTTRFPITEGSPVLREYLALGVYLTLIGVFVFQQFGLYARRIGMERKSHAWSILSALGVTYVFLMAWLFVYENWQYTHSRWVIFLSFDLVAGGSILTHSLLRQLQAILIRRGLGFERTVVVAAGEDLQRVHSRLRACYGSRHHILGFMVPEMASGTLSVEDPVLGGISEIEKILHRDQVDRVVIAVPPRYCAEALDVFRKCRERGIVVHMVPSLFEAVTRSVSVGQTGRIPTISLGETPLTGSYRIMKDLLEVVMAGVLLILSLPLMAVISVLIKLDSRGPVIYRQERIGADGEPFILLKFRTMELEAERSTGPVFARENDPRCTRVGRFLRQYNLDELPQFYNVLKGDMAVVGPRPERPHFVNQFKGQIPGYMQRHLVKPGITGWAQIHGLRGNTSVKDRTRFDMYYVENWSLGLDLKILLRTLSSHRNAY